ncbi:tol-pal system protein YbgF [Pseudopelagicola sp. nBUS_20]|uniref:tol-pal system protein YbgF n=1 Tax=Pseudopelagicola sp. nBUS_20 TaxID=3395317 RepID=UPI003EBA6CF0
MRSFPALGLALFLALTPVAGVAQSRDETLADIRQQLSVLYVEIQRLKRELSTTSSPETFSGSNTLERLDAIEARLQDLTGKTERLGHKVQRVVEDGTNRLGDLEFRLVELEGGDLSKLGESSTLGGEIGKVPSFGSDTSLNSVDEVETELAIGETADFGRARLALQNGDFRAAVDQFAGFVSTYPGSPLESEAHLRRGQAHEELGEMTRAARAFLEAYSGVPQGPIASEALFHLGRALGQLGQVSEACVTLNEVSVRYPGTREVAQAQGEMSRLQCP